MMINDIYFIQRKNKAGTHSHIYIKKIGLNKEVAFSEINF